MLGSTNRERSTSGGLTQPLGGRVYRYGKQVECELCETVKQCLDHHGLVTCQTCQTEFLPRSNSVLYFG